MESSLPKNFEMPKSLTCATYLCLGEYFWASNHNEQQVQDNHDGDTRMMMQHLSSCSIFVAYPILGYENTTTS